jgi:large subunit ribosomal protein L15
MKLHNLTPAEGSVKSGRRIARGPASGSGGTAGRGHKGAKSRSGYKSKRHFEGGQMPLQMRLPKRGFKSPNRIETVPMNLGRLQQIADKFGVSDISITFLISNNIISSGDVLKILASGELSSALRVEGHACSEAAKSAIEAKGGSITII